MKKKSMVLLVDDDRELIELMKFNFEQRGWEVKASYDGMDAILKINRFKPDIVISDIMMPGVDGYSLLDTIKQDKNLKTIPFIFISGIADIENRIRGFSGGADDYLVKPFAFEELFARSKSRLNVFNKMQELESKGLRGNLAVLSVSDLLQNLTTTYKTGIIKIENSKVKGEMKIKDGKLLDVKVGNKTGWPAFYCLMTQNSGNFSFVEEKLRGRKLEKSVERMILEFARQYDEEQRTLKVLGGKNIVFSVISEKKDTKEKIVNELFKLIDKGRTLNYMIDKLPYSSSQIVEKIFNLLSEGYIRKI